jgi:mycothiol synthase
MTAMHESSPSAQGPPGDPRPAPIRRVDTAMLVQAASRLVGGAGPGASQAGRAFLERARTHGIDLTYFWASFPSSGGISQAALVVPQVGRTAMIFLSGPGPRRPCGEPVQQRADRIAVVKAAIEGTDRLVGAGIQLFQALPAPQETWGVEAFSGAGMTRLGDLAYLRRPFTMRGDGEFGGWPRGVSVRPITRLEEDADRPALRRALARTYIETLDCPGLCELRSVDDVIESHKSAGSFDHAQWWLIEHEGEAEGCVLLSPSFETKSLELVYMGLGPALRGKGLARVALAFAIQRAQRLALDEISCAVDMINEPARAVYARLGFTEFARRIAFVCPSTSNPGR